MIALRLLESAASEWNCEYSVNHALVRSWVRDGVTAVHMVMSYGGVVMEPAIH